MNEYPWGSAEAKAAASIRVDAAVTEMRTLWASNDPPNILWHYTSLESFFEIVTHQTLRHSAYYLLNDPTEGRGAEGLIRGLMENVGERVFPEPIREAIDSYLNEKDLPAVPTTVFSLSERLDHLQQWRLYANNGRGVAIGFSSQRLETDVGRPRRVLYQLPAIPTALAEAIVDMFDQFAPGPFAEHLGALFSTLGREFGYLYKSSDWSDEAEWRLLSIPQRSSLQAGAHAGGARLYQDIGFQPETVAAICLGPRIALHERKAIRDFLHARDWDAEIVLSERQLR